MGEEKISRKEKRKRQIEQMRALMEENGGVVKTAQLYTLGMDYRRIQSYVDSEVIERVKNGYYAMNYKKKDEKEIILTMFSDCVLCMESALYCYHYINEKPYKWTLAVNKNTSKSRFKLDYPLLQPYYTEPEVLTLGITSIPFGSGKMSIYTKERLICDILKYEDRIEKDDLQNTLRTFIMDQDKDVAKLLMFAKERKVLTKVRNQIGVWL